jgi:hypothetical protein
MSKFRFHDDRSKFKSSFVAIRYFIYTGAKFFSWCIISASDIIQVKDIEPGIQYLALLLKTGNGSRGFNMGFVLQ